MLDKKTKEYMINNVQGLSNQEMEILYVIAKDNQKVADDLKTGPSGNIAQDEQDTKALENDVNELNNVITNDPNANQNMKATLGGMVFNANTMLLCEEQQGYSFGQANDCVNNINGCATFLIQGE